MLDGVRDGDLITCPHLGLSWPYTEVSGAPATGAAQLAVLPTAVAVVAEKASGAVATQVTSVLFDDGDYSVTLESRSGHRFRATVSGGRSAVGDRVGMRVYRPLGYAG